MPDLKNKITFVMAGRSGSGKGAQSKFLVRKLKKYGLRRIETGRLLRGLLKKRNITTDLASGRIMSAGKLMPSWFAYYSYLKKFIEHGWASEHLVFDGAPRKVKEAEFMDDVLAWHGRPLPVCVYINVSRQESVRRLLKRSRSDDYLRAIHNRQKFFETDVIPMIDYYRRHKRLIVIDGDKDQKLVSRDLENVLREKYKKLFR